MPARSRRSSPTRSLPSEADVCRARRDYLTALPPKSGNVARWRTSWMQRTITHIQKAAYGKYQIADVQKNRLTPRPSPLAIAHQPSQRPTTRVDSTTHPQHTAKLAMASQMLANPRLPLSNAKLATAGSMSAAPKEAALQLTSTSRYAGSTASYTSASADH